MNEIANWYKSIPQQKQVLVIAGGIVITLLLLYALVWQPWQATLDNLRARVPEKTKTVYWMRRELESIRPILARQSNRLNNDIGDSVLAKVERSAKQFKIHEQITRMSPNKKKQVKLWVDNGNFNQWLRWLEELRRNDIEVIQINIAATKTLGSVTIQATLMAAL